MKLIEKIYQLEDIWDQPNDRLRRMAVFLYIVLYWEDNHKYKQEALTLVLSVQYFTVYEREWMYDAVF